MTTLPLSPKHRPTQTVRGSTDEVLGAGNEIRTRDPNLGKVVLYQLSYSRWVEPDILEAVDPLSSDSDAGYGSGPSVRHP